MKKITLIIIASLSMMNVRSQESAKAKADSLAKNEFSKTKQERKEKYGIAKEKYRVIESIPVVTTDLSFYHGNYVYPDLDYKIEIRKGNDDKLMATLSIPDSPDIILKNVTISDAHFQAVKQNIDGTQEKWEGVFINKTDNGNTEFGLGLKLSDPIQLTESNRITRIFLKKVSP